MSTFVSLEEAKAHLNVTDDGDNDLITAKIKAAEDHVWNIIGAKIGDAEIPDSVREAILQLTAHFYENREAALVGVTAQAVPFGVHELLAPNREWVF